MNINTGDISDNNDNRQKQRLCINTDEVANTLTLLKQTISERASRTPVSRPEDSLSYSKNTYRNEGKINILSIIFRTTETRK